MGNPWTQRASCIEKPKERVENKVHNSRSLIYCGDWVSPQPVTARWPAC